MGRKPGCIVETGFGTCETVLYKVTGGGKHRGPDQANAVECIHTKKTRSYLARHDIASMLRAADCLGRHPHAKGK